MELTNEMIAAWAAFDCYEKEFADAFNLLFDKFKRGEKTKDEVCKDILAIKNNYNAFLDRQTEKPQNEINGIRRALETVCQQKLSIIESWESVVECVESAAKATMNDLNNSVRQKVEAAVKTYQPPVISWYEVPGYTPPQQYDSIDLIRPPPPFPAIRKYLKIKYEGKVVRVPGWEPQTFPPTTLVAGTEPAPDVQAPESLPPVIQAVLNEGLLDDTPVNGKYLKKGNNKDQGIILSSRSIFLLQS